MKDFNYLLGKIETVLYRIVPFIIGLAVFFIIWQIFNYVMSAADEEKRSEAKKYIVYGVIGVFLMLSVWGLVNIVYNTFNLDNRIDPDQIPQVPHIEIPDGGTPDNIYDNDGDGFPDDPLTPF